MSATTIPIIQASIATSIDLGLFRDGKSAADAHIFSSIEKTLNENQIRNLGNFNAEQRLQSSATLAYPKTDRPRGASDLRSVRHFQKLLLAKQKIPAIWVYRDRKTNKLTLLDGVDRIVANHLFGNKTIDSMFVKK